MSKPFATKGEFVTFISENNDISKKEVESIIGIFTSSITRALKQGKDVHLIGFGSFYVSDVAGRDGRNPRTGVPLKIKAYKAPKFKAGKKLKDACKK